MTTAINDFRCTGICTVDNEIFPDHMFAAAITNEDNQDNSDQGTTHGPSICQRGATLLHFTSAATTFESSTRPAATTDSLTSMPATTTQSLTSMAELPVLSTNPAATSHSFTSLPAILESFTSLPATNVPSTRTAVTTQ